MIRMSPPVSRVPCFLHPERDAAARCMGCSKCLCRECVTGFGGRLLCLECLSLQGDGSSRPRKRSVLPALVFQLVLGFLGLWLGFYCFGKLAIKATSVELLGEVERREGFSGKVSEAKRP